MLKYFPSDIKPEYPLSETIEDNSITSKFEDGSVQSRRKFTRNRISYKLKFNLSESDYEVLKEFIKKDACYGANVIRWQHPVTREFVDARIAKVGAAEYNTQDRWTLELELQEV